MQSDKTHRWKYLHIHSFQGSLCERVIAWGCLDHGWCSCVMLSGFWGMGPCNAVTGLWDLTKGAVYWPWLGIRKLSFIYIYTIQEISAGSFHDNTSHMFGCSGWLVGWNLPQCLLCLNRMPFSTTCRATTALWRTRSRSDTGPWTSAWALGPRKTWVSKVGSTGAFSYLSM